LKKNFFLVFGILVLFYLNGCSSTYIFSHHPQLSERYYLIKVKKALKKAEKNPTNSEYLFQAQKLLTQYGYAFQLEEAERYLYKNIFLSKKAYENASKSFIKAVEYGKNNLRIFYPEIDKWLLNPKNKKIIFNPKHVAYLYWTAASIGGLIKSSKGAPETIVLFPQIGFLLKQALEINPAWDNGAIFTALISYSMSEYPLTDEKKKNVKTYFDEVIKYSEGKSAAPYVTYAESVSVKAQDREEFIYLLNQALVISYTENDELNLENHISQIRAKWLLSRIDELFY
tara:strand:+ start:36140 stop:36994 length:855 start_codon:yes stop_codon:yes gene_type:complete